MLVSLIHTSCLKDLLPGAIVLYLKTNGWAKITHQYPPGGHLNADNDIWFYFEKDFEKYPKAEIYVPRYISFADYPRRVNELLQLLQQVEERSLLLIINEMDSNLLKEFLDKF